MKRYLCSFALAAFVAAAGCGRDNATPANSERETGTTGTTATEPGREQPDYYQPDNTQGSLRANLENIMRREFGAEKQMGINFDVADDGKVTIKGRVDSEAMKTHVAELVSATQGVTDVVNELEVRDSR